MLSTLHSVGLFSTLLTFLFVCYLNENLCLSHAEVRFSSVYQRSSCFFSCLRSLCIPAPPNNHTLKKSCCISTVQSLKLHWEKNQINKTWVKRSKQKKEKKKRLFLFHFLWLMTPRAQRTVGCLDAALFPRSASHLSRRAFSSLKPLIFNHHSTNSAAHREDQSWQMTFSTCVVVFPRRRAAERLLSDGQSNCGAACCFHH